MRYVYVKKDGVVKKNRRIYFIFIFRKQMGKG